MIAQVKKLLNSFMPEEDLEFDNTLAIVCLLCEVCVADENYTAEEEATILQTLKKLVNISSAEAVGLLKAGMEEIKVSNSVYDFTSQLSNLDAEMRIALIKAMWEVAYADGQLNLMEEALIRKVAALIYVNHSDFIRTKLAVVEL